MKFIEKIFSIKNEKNYKIITILGLKLKIFSNKLANKLLVKRLEKYDVEVQQLQKKNIKLEHEIGELKKANSRSDYIHNKRFEQWLLTYRWLEFHSKLINKLIDFNNDEELKKAQIKYLFKNIHKNEYLLDIDNPTSFNEKIQWLSLNYYSKNEEIHRIVDKYKFKEYIAEKLGDGYTIPLLGRWENVEEINFETLPDKFVLKSNWGGDGRQIKIVEDKEKLNIEELKKQMKEWLSFDGYMYYYAFNGPSKGLKPCILAENYVNGLGSKYYDYKIFCFNGKPQIIYVASNWAYEHKMSYYDTEWNKLDLVYSNYESFNKERPKNLDKMLDIATELSKDFPFVRIDFFDLIDKVVLSEMTYTPGGGFGMYKPLDWDYKLGEMLDISELIGSKNE